MRVRWLGWAGVELQADGASVVIDPLQDAGAVFAPLGDPAAAAPRPAVVPAAEGAAVAGAVTHLHRDHADAGALAAALAPGAPVFEPPRGGGDAFENLALAQADAELDAHGLGRRCLGPGESATEGPFTLTALPAADGLGDPQVAWLIEADGERVLHLGDTMYHGYWWRMARRHGPFDVVCVPVNGAVISFPHRVPPSPLPAALDPATGALVAQILGARLAVPIHAEGYEVDGVYEPVADAAERFAAAAADLGVPTRILDLGETIDVAEQPAALPGR